MSTDTTELSLAALEASKLEAFVEMMFLAAHADGEVRDPEREVFRSVLLESSGGQLPASLVDAVLAQMEKAAANESREERLARIRERITDPRMRRAALVLAARVVLADGVVEASERAFLDRAASVLQLDTATVKAALEEVREG